MRVVDVRVDELRPYGNNSRVHSDVQVRQLADSIAEFGFVTPILVDVDRSIIAGHGRVLAASLLGLETVPCVVADHLSDVQKRAYVIADNRLAEQSEWDFDMLARELAELNVHGFDLQLTGFDGGLLEDVVGLSGVDVGSDPTVVPNKYVDNVVAPVYEMTGVCPFVGELYSSETAELMLAEIDAAGLPEDVAKFLRFAAMRHVVFNFAEIAEFYAHADAKTQRLMERSALVIVDFDKAVEYGFARVIRRLQTVYNDEFPDTTG